MNIVTFFCMFLAVIFAGLTQSIKTKRSETAPSNVEFFEGRPFNIPYFFISFMILFLACFISASGNDTGGYALRFETWTLFDLLDISIEPGYKLLNLFLHIFIKEGYVGIGVIKLISIGLIYKSIYLLRNRVSIGIAVLAYVCMLYIYNFQLLRMMLAVGIAYLALAYEIIEENKRALCLLCIAPLFHYSAIVLLLIYFIYLSLGKKLNLFKIITVSVLLGVVLVFGSEIINTLVNNIAFLNKYSAYTRNETALVGMGQIIVFIPVLYLLIYAYKYEKDDSEYCLSMLLGIMTFVIGVLGYSIPVIGRASYYFRFFFIYYAASVVQKWYPGIYLKFGNCKTSLNKCIVIVYLIFMLILYLMGGSLKSAGLDGITYIWEVI